jgi:hypothetical protein
VKTPSLHTLIAQPGSGSGAAPPEGEASQGPSLVDYNLKIEADFPKELVLTMKENAAKKARRTVIGRTLGGRATFKTLPDCLKLHLPLPQSRPPSSQEVTSKFCSKTRREPKPPGA